MANYSHQFLIAITVENGNPDPEKVTLKELQWALTYRTTDIARHDGLEAFQHNDTEEI